MSPESYSATCKHLQGRTTVADSARLGNFADRLGRHDHLSAQFILEHGRERSPRSAHAGLTHFGGSLIQAGPLSEIPEPISASRSIRGGHLRVEYVTRSRASGALRILTPPNRVLFRNFSRSPARVRA